MADFIAVIRRAVDGLSDNTPEMRAKVYERARAAVVRQLENMKPRPPEAMFQRQLDKLDAAIREVEAEHSEAQPAEELAAEELPAGAGTPPEIAEAQRIAVSEPAPVEEQQPAVVEHEPVEEPIQAVEAAPVQEPVMEPAEASHPEELVSEPEPIESVQEQAAEAEPEIEAEAAEHVEPETVVPAYVTSPESAEPEARLEPEAHPAQLDVKSYEAVPELPHGETPTPAEEPPAVHPVPSEPVYQPFATPEVEEEPVAEAGPIAAEPMIADEIPRDPLLDHAVEPARQWAVEVDKEPAVVEEPAREEPAPAMPRVSYDETDVVAGFNDFLKQELNRKVVPPPPARKTEKQDDFSWDAPFDDLPEIPKPVSFEKALEAKQREIAADAESRKAQPQATPVSPRTELEDLIGIDRDERRAPASVGEAGGLPPEVSRAVSKLEGKSFKVQKKKNKGKRGFRLLPIAVAAAAALVLAGGGFALWYYKDDVGGLMTSILPAEQPAQPADATNTKSDAKSPASDKDVATDASTQDQPAKETEVASLETDSGPQKFTQRLLPDGSETDTDTARVPVDQALPEGKTVAGQTEKGKEVAATATDTKSDAADAGKPPESAQPIGATQKMFLYEERLGQSSPVAVPGTVVWTEKASTDSGKPDPSIEAQIDIPQRSIKALISIKRNNDASLPASHIIEIVFALPNNFEEGNIESIQRVAFKQTEQDRGNPLIAVPAKITDDFHMVALNDDADARKVNLELMKTRSWIDIPITYRNGRRALITLEKGATGTTVFDKVMGEWAALGPQTAN